MTVFKLAVCDMSVIFQKKKNKSPSLPMSGQEVWLFLEYTIPGKNVFLSQGQHHHLDSSWLGKQNM